MAKVRQNDPFCPIFVGLGSGTIFARYRMSVLGQNIYVDFCADRTPMNDTANYTVKSGRIFTRADFFVDKTNKIVYTTNGRCIIYIIYMLMI